MSIASKSVFPITWREPMASGLRMNLSESLPWAHDPMEVLDMLEDNLRVVTNIEQLQDWLNQWPAYLSKDMPHQWQLRASQSEWIAPREFRTYLQFECDIREGFVCHDRMAYRHSIDDQAMYRSFSTPGVVYQMAQRSFLHQLKTHFLQLAEDRLTP